MNRIVLYILGTLLVMGGAAWIAIQLGAPPMWVIVGCVILLGIGIMGAASNARTHGNTHVSVHDESNS